MRLETERLVTSVEISGGPMARRSRDKAGPGVPIWISRAAEAILRSRGVPRRVLDEMLGCSVPDRRKGYGKGDHLKPKVVTS